LISSEQLADVNQHVIDEKNNKIEEINRKLEKIDEGADDEEKDSLTKALKQLETDIKRLKNPETKNKTAICRVKQNKLVNAVKEVKIRQSLSKPLIDSEMKKCKEDENCELAKVNRQIEKYIERFADNCR